MHCLSMKNQLSGAGPASAGAAAPNAAAAANATSTAGGADAADAPKAPFSLADAYLNNHADVHMSFCLLAVIGYMNNYTADFVAPFVVASYDHPVKRDLGHVTVDVTEYGTGPLDLALLLFLVCFWLSVRAIVQEFILDKFILRLKFSSIRTHELFESAFRIFFYGIVVFWSWSIIRDNSYITNSASLTAGFPHLLMDLSTKLLLLSSIAFWLHNIPWQWIVEARPEQIRTRVIYSLINAAFVAAAYYLHYSRVSVCLLGAQAVSELLYSFYQLFEQAKKEDLARKSFQAWAVVFVFVRQAIITLLFKVFWSSTAVAAVPEPASAEGATDAQTVAVDEPQGAGLAGLVFAGAILAVQGVAIYQFIALMLTHKHGLSSLLSGKPKAAKQSDAAASNSSEASKKAKKQK
ncbi:hypothetical protein CAOG_005021 [Capsaspora owczarzaki ATCC 30864]|uniref:TLC domain-containing protein n=1 Tax=Capsaspora owczarzaki (strain ATCC 30864) TaxID=595528 RepID=A0A0D2WR79_CAPO3|nr:hypothetical protein CAOG_005021 [Capsaspora owczarzaki ATCC 30864]